MTNDLLTQLQALSDTPLHVLSEKPGRWTAHGELPGGGAALAARVAPLGGRLAEEDDGSAIYRLDELEAVVSCTSFGGLFVQQVPDVERFIASYLRG